MSSLIPDARTRNEQEADRNAAIGRIGGQVDFSEEPKYALVQRKGEQLPGGYEDQWLVAVFADDSDANALSGLLNDEYSASEQPLFKVVAYEDAMDADSRF